MLQQARQRDDVFVRDVCFATKKVVTTPSRVSTRTNNPTVTKKTHVPMDVSQTSSNVSKSEPEGQESDSCLYEQDQDCDGDECSRSRAKVKVASKNRGPASLLSGTEKWYGLLEG